MLDNNVVELVNDIQQFVTDFIWIGKANFLLRRLKMNGFTDLETLSKANKLIDLKSDNNIRKLYERLKSKK